MARAEHRGDVAQEHGGVGHVELTSRNLDGLARLAQHRAALALDPAFVQLVADGAARGQRAVEVDAPARHVAAQAERERLGRFEDDERIDGAAGTGAHGAGERRLGVTVLAESGERAGLGAQERRADRLVLAPDELGIGLFGDADDLVPVFEPLEVRAAREIVREVVPGACGEVVSQCHLATLVQELTATLEVSLLQFKRC